MLKSISSDIRRWRSETPDLTPLQGNQHTAPKPREDDSRNHQEAAVLHWLWQVQV